MRGARAVPCLATYRDDKTDTTSAGFYQPGASALSDVHPLWPVPGKVVGAGVIASSNGEHVAPSAPVAPPSAGQTWFWPSSWQLDGTIVLQWQGMTPDVAASVYR